MTEAEDLFAEQVARWRGASWASLRGHLKDSVAYELKGSSGAIYQFELIVVWDGRRGGNLRVFFTGDDGKGWRMRGMREDGFIKAPDDSFVGEDAD